MTDILESELVDVEREVAEKKETISRDTKGYILDATIKAMGGDLTQRARKSTTQLERTPNFKSYLEKATTQRDFALALNIARQLDTDFSKLSEIQKKTVERYPELSIFLLGPVSVLTLNDLGRHCRGEAPPSIDDVAGRPEQDAKFGLDFVQYAGERNGKKVYNLVQIKTTSEGYMDIMEIDGDHNDYLGVGFGSAHQLLNTAKEWSDKYDEEYRAFVVLVPAYDSNRINNIYGIIQDATLYDEFKEVAQKTGYFLPEEDEKR